MRAHTCSPRPPSSATPPLVGAWPRVQAPGWRFTESPEVVAGSLLALRGHLFSPGARLRQRGPLLFQEAPEGALAPPGYVQVSPTLLPSQHLPKAHLEVTEPRPVCRGENGKAGLSCGPAPPRASLGGHMTPNDSGDGSGADPRLEMGRQKHLPPGRLRLLSAASWGTVASSRGPCRSMRLPVLILACSHHGLEFLRWSQDRRKSQLLEAPIWLTQPLVPGLLFPCIH